MAPVGRKCKEVAKESGAQNVGDIPGVPRGRRGRPAGGVAQDIDVEVEQISKGVNEMKLVVARFQRVNPSIFCGSEGSEKADSWLRAMNNLFNLVEYD